MTTGLEDRRYWVELLTRIATPVLSALAQHKLRATMPVETAKGLEKDRRQFAHLEALGRLLTGMAPWIELAEGGAGVGDAAEAQTCARLAELARRAIDAGTDPQSPDLLNFTKGQQPLVDTAFLAHAMLRAPQHLFHALPAKTQAHLIAALQATRDRRPFMNNWLMFAAMTEAALCMMGQVWDRARVDAAIEHHQQWYKGDGAYGDGPEFHWDYYNSFVIHPMLIDVLETLGKVTKDWEPFHAPVLKRARRYAAVQERFISPEGAYPPIGRSLAYRSGAFQLLAQMALRHELPLHVAPAQVRCALTAVLKRLFDAPATFDKDGWLTIGLCGHQPGLGESYVSTGSTYLCSAAFLPLGLPADDPFWSAPPTDWTSKKIWAGVEVPCDHAE